MRNAPEVVREVGVNDVRVAAEKQPFHLYDRLLGVSPSAVGVDFRWKISFEDRLQHQRRCCHADPIPHGRHAPGELHSDPINLWDRLKSPIRFIPCAASGSSF